jgi:outer membrane biosynthesis protein TonB
MTDLDAGTKRELKVEIEALSQKLGATVPPELDRANKAQLTALVVSLRERASGGAPAPVAPAPPPAGPELEPAPAGVEVKPEAPAAPAPEAPPAAPAAEAPPAPPPEAPAPAPAPAKVKAPKPAPPPVPVVDALRDPLSRKPAKLKPSYPYTVAEGKVVTTARGPIGSFGAVRASDFSGGQTQLDGLVASGAVVKS